MCVGWLFIKLFIVYLLFLLYAIYFCCFFILNLIYWLLYNSFKWYYYLSICSWSIFAICVKNSYLHVSTHYDDKIRLIAPESMEFIILFQKIFNTEFDVFCGFCVEVMSGIYDGRISFLLLNIMCDNKNIFIYWYTYLKYN